MLVIFSCYEFFASVRNAGYGKPRLDALFRDLNIAIEVRDCHSALHDAELLMVICMKKWDLLLLDHSQSFNDILLHLRKQSCKTNQFLCQVQVNDK